MCDYMLQYVADIMYNQHFHTHQEVFYQTNHGFFLLFWEHGPWHLNWEFRGVLLKIGNF